MKINKINQNNATNNEYKLDNTTGRWNPRYRLFALPLIPKQIQKLARGAARKFPGYLARSPGQLLHAFGYVWHKRKWVLSLHRRTILLFTFVLVPNRLGKGVDLGLELRKFNVES